MGFIYEQSYTFDRDLKIVYIVMFSIFYELFTKQKRHGAGDDKVNIRRGARYCNPVITI